MSTMISELYDALRKAGVDEQLARDASRAVLAAETVNDLATKADFADLKTSTRGDIAALRADMRADMAELKADLLKWNVGAMAVLTGIFAAIVRLG